MHAMPTSSRSAKIAAFYATASPSVQAEIIRLLHELLPDLKTPAREDIENCLKHLNDSAAGGAGAVAKNLTATSFLAAATDTDDAPHFRMTLTQKTDSLTITFENQSDRDKSLPLLMDIWEERNEVHAGARPFSELASKPQAEGNFAIKVMGDSECRDMCIRLLKRYKQYEITEVAPAS